MLDEGKVTVEDGDGYPVVRWAKGRWRGRMAPGTGIVPQHNDIGKISRDTSYQRKREYREVLEFVIPADADETKRGTVGWLLNQGMTAAEGIDTMKDVECPVCEHEFKIAVYKRPDTKAVLGMLEMVIGRAAEQKDISVRFEDLQLQINERRDTGQLKVFEVSPHEKLLCESTEVTEGEFKEVECCITNTGTPIRQGVTRFLFLVIRGRLRCHMSTR